MYEGTLVRLRTMEPSDAERLLTWINDPDVTEHLAVRYPMSLANEVDWVETNKTVNYGNAVFAVETIAEGRHIGGVDIRTGSGPENRKGELGLMVGDKSVWGGGYGTDLVRTACRFGFDEMNLNRVELWVHGSNERAIGVYERVGFVREGAARQGWYKRGQYHDLVLMGLLRDEFKPA
ncbi:MAG TPA: GNAT family protein [Mycobacteriales bacterium]|jgi:RimJ/RimL family protein N-acetyltransferase|nr:GNAT family protein [Mycobacteriales bacterium]